ncbi:MAG: EamA family transporter, partial [Microbacterium sp.]
MSEPAPAVTAGRSPRVYTASGFVAIAIWGLSPAVLRLVGESLGLFTTGAVVNLSAGVLGLIVMRVITGHWPAWRDLRSARFIQGGVLFVLYTVTQFAATILAHTREEVVVVTGIKFLWPLVTLLISIAVLKHRWGRMLVLGVALSAAGTYSMVLGDVAVGDILSVLDSWSAMLPLLLALASCTAWGCYSVLLAVHEGRKSGGADLVGPWMLLSGIVMGVGALLLGESSVWRVSLVWE